MALPIILASASPARLELLQKLGIVPDEVIPSDVEETILKKEKPRLFAARMSLEKAKNVADRLERGIVIGADTVPVCRNKIMRKTITDEDVKNSLEMLSHRRHRVYTGVTVIRKDGDNLEIRTKIVETLLKFKKLNYHEINQYCLTKEGIGKAGGYSLSGHAESFVTFMSGSFSNVVGLPLYETSIMLK